MRYDRLFGARAAPFTLIVSSLPWMRSVSNLEGWLRADLAARGAAPPVSVDPVWRTAADLDGAPRQHSGTLLVAFDNDEQLQVPNVLLHLRHIRVRRMRSCRHRRPPCFRRCCPRRPSQIRRERSLYLAARSLPLLRHVARQHR